MSEANCAACQTLQQPRSQVTGMNASHLMRSASASGVPCDRWPLAVPACRSRILHGSRPSNAARSPYPGSCGHTHCLRGCRTRCVVDTMPSAVRVAWTVAALRAVVPVVSAAGIYFPACAATPSSLSCVMMWLRSQSPRNLKTSSERAIEPALKRFWRSCTCLTKASCAAWCSLAAA